MTMRKIEMRSIDPEQPAIVEFVEGHHYLAVVVAPAEATAVHRRATLDEVRRVTPVGVAVIVLPHGYTFDVWEDAPDADPEAGADCAYADPSHNSPAGCSSCGRGKPIIRESA